MKAMPLSQFYIGRVRRRGLVLGYGGVSLPEIEEGVTLLAPIVRELLDTRSLASASD